MGASSKPKVATNSKSPATPFKRQGLNVKLPSSTKRAKLPNRVYTAGTAEGVAVLYVVKPAAKESAYIKPFLDWLEDEETGEHNLEKCKIFAIKTRRDPSKVDNTPIRQDSKSDWPAIQFLHFYEDPANNTSHNRRQWAVECVLPQLNRLGRMSVSEGGFQYLSTFQYSGDVSHDPVMPLDYYLMDEDVVTIVSLAYPSAPVEDLVKQRQLIETFFSDYGNGKTLLLANEAITD